MKCTICAQEMNKIRQDTSTNPNENHKEYDRAVYQCLQDDVWISVEKPKESDA